MRELILCRFTLLFVLFASAAVAKDRAPNVRNLFLSDDPADAVGEVYVAGQVVTVLRLQQPCEPERTRMLGWEGRFEPVECVGKRVLVEPLQDLEPRDRFLLLVTLKDGKELPFTVTAVGEQAWKGPDQQVNVFLEPETQDALRARLNETRVRERLLEEAARRHFREDTADHALAKLLATGAIRQTSFVERKKRIVKSEDGVSMVVRLYSGKAKAAVLFTVKNSHRSKPWSLLEARLRTVRHEHDPRPPFLFGEPRPFALRVDRDEVAPGEVGNIAVVVDKSAFQSESTLLKFLALELYRHDGLMDTHVLLDRRLIRE